MEEGKGEIRTGSRVGEGWFTSQGAVRYSRGNTVTLASSSEHNTDQFTCRGEGVQIAHKPLKVYTHTHTHTHTLNTHTHTLNTHTYRYTLKQYIIEA